MSATGGHYEDDTVYYLVEYLKAAKRASYAVSYTQNSTLSVGLIQYFVEVRDGERESVLAVLHILHIQRVQSMPHRRNRNIQARSHSLHCSEVCIAYNKYYCNLSFSHSSYPYLSVHAC